MANPLDTLFIEMAVARGWIERAQADEAVSIQEATKDDGEGRRLLRDIVVDEGWMTQEQVTEVDTQIDEGAAKTGKIEGYRLIAKIGQGGMGAVYKAEQAATGEVVALKILPTRLARRPDFVDRFLREARAAAKMKSEHIVRPVDVGFSGGYYYFAMEFVEGESVDTTLSIDGAMAETKALRIIHQIALALADAEKAGMVHRDIKPGNIIVTEKGVAKLTDFGLAREVADDSVTQAGMTLGTPNYMSPEQAKAVKALDVRSDIYSLGVTFYYMVTGVLPFQGETSLLTMLKHLNEPPVAPITRRAELTRGCNDVILKMLAKNREDRYQNASQLVEDLTLVMNGKPPKHAESTEQKPPPVAEEAAAGAPEEMEDLLEEIREQRRLKWLKAGIGLFVVVIVGVIVYALVSPGPRPDAAAGAGNAPDAAAAQARQERIAQARLDEAKRFAAEHPSELAAIVDKYASVEAKHRSAKAYDEASRLRAEAARKLDAAVQAAFEACRKAATELTAKDKFGEAIAAYDAFPDELRSQQVAERVGYAKQNVERHAWERFKELQDQANVFLQMSRFGAARAVVGPATQFGIPGVAAEAQKLLAEIDRVEAAAGSEEKGRAFAAYQEAAAKIRIHVRGGLFDRALEELDRHRNEATEGLVRDLLTDNRVTIVAARKVWDFVVKGAATIEPGFEVRVGPVARKFVSYDAETGRMRFRGPDGRTVPMSPGWLPPADLRRLARKGSGDEEVAAIWFVAFFMARGDFAAAEEDLKRAKEEGASAILTQRYEKQLALGQKSREEIEAENLLARAREQAAAREGGLEQAARTLWALVAAFSDTRCFAEHRKEIEELLTRVEVDGIRADTLFAVTPREQPEGMVELRYDFSDPAQAADWLTVWQGQSTGRWSIRPGDGEMVADAGMVYFKVPLRGNYRIDIEGRDIRSASIRFGMPSPTASPRAAGLSFGFRRAGDGVVSSLEAAGTALGPAREEARFRVVGALTLSVEVKKGAVTARAGDIRPHYAPADAKPVQSDAPGYIVLDGFNLGARISSIVLSFEMDREWLEREFIGPLRKAKLEELRWRMARYEPLLEGKAASAWRPSDAGHWTLSAGYATARENARCILTTGDVNWRNYAFAAKVRVGSAAGVAWLMVRWADAAGAGGAARGYYVELAARATSGRILLGKSDGGRTETLKQADVQLTGTEWYPVYVEVHGPSIRVFLAGQEVLGAEDEAYASGGIGLASFLCGAQFTDIKIKVMK